MEGKVCFKSNALLLLRLTLGVVFIAHGGQKVFGLFGGMGLEPFVKWMGTLGVADWLAYSAAYAELAGGCLMLLGFLAELGALLTMPVMAGAVWFVHWNKGFFVQNGGFEYPLVLFFLALAVIIGGPGAKALWNPFKSCR